MPELVSDEQLLQLFRRASKWMTHRHHHGDSANKPAHGQHETDRDHHLRRHLLVDGQARHAQGRILFILSEREGLNQRELLDMLHVRSATLSELLSKLERNQLILRQRDEKDKRNYRLFLTESGRATLEEHRKHRQEIATHLFAALDETERASLAALLTRLLTLWGEGNQREQRQTRSES
ncbi:MAG: MarR family transcriptional regulator [Burkholderiales bacterium]|jgi:DNA-binding MarR family transcriptional regulator|nr:MarR family transcriptional regulator [Burkholderiales bacterium]